MFRGSWVWALKSSNYCTPRHKPPPPQTSKVCAFPDMHGMLYFQKALGTRTSNMMFRYLFSNFLMNNVSPLTMYNLFLCTTPSSGIKAIQRQKKYAMMAETNTNCFPKLDCISLWIRNWKSHWNEIWKAVKTNPVQLFPKFDCQEEALSSFQWVFRHFVTK